MEELEENLEETVVTGNNNLNYWYVEDKILTNKK